MTNKQERGAIMLEVLAVLALIGVMGPMLYKQVLSRNQEISNVNIAAEMRAIKEAMTAAIAADSAVLGHLCGTGHDSLTACNAGDATFQTTVEEFLPIGMDGLLDGSYGYTVKLYSYDATLQNGENYPIVVGVVAGTRLAGDWNMKRAARIANLIGTDGGIVQGADLIGTGGSWQLNGLANDLASELDAGTDAIVVATTAMDTFDPDLGSTEPDAVAVPGSLAFSDLHAWNYFSVGTVTEGSKCFELSRTLTSDGGGSGDVVQADTIKHVGTSNCDPLFWVGTKGVSGDNSISGQVYVKNNLYIGRDNTENKQAFAFEAKGTKEQVGDAVVDNTRIVVYNIDGGDTLTIDATGKIVSDKTTKIKIKEKQSDGSEESVEKNFNYGLDVANTSVLNDVRLGARGGARLSDILPNYIAKGMTHLSPSTHAQEISIVKPDCPDGYAAAIIVTPLKWATPNIISVQVPEVSAAHSLKVSGTSVSGEIKVPSYEMEFKNVVQNRHNFAIEIDGNSDHGYDTKPAKEKSWKVKLGYKTDNTTDGVFQSLSDYEDGEIQALAQTYCVYAPTDATYDPNGLTDDKKIPDNLKK